MPTANKFLSSILKFSVASWLSAGIALISIPIVTRFFTPEEFGKINMFIMAMGIIAAVVGLSMEQSYVRFFKETESEQGRKTILTQCIAVVLCCFALFLISNLFLGRWLSFYLFGEMNPILIYVALPLMVLLTIIMYYQSTYFRMSEKVVGYTVISILGVLANKVAMVGAAFYEPNYTMGLIFTTISFFLLVLFCCVFSPASFSINFPKIKSVEVKPLLKYAVPLVPVAFIALLNTFVIRFMLKDYVSYSALGIFVAAFTIANVITLVQSGFNVYWVPFMFANYKTEQAFIKKIHSAISFVMVAFALLIILFSDLIFLVLGDSYRSGQNIFAFLLIYPVVYTISETTSCGIAISKKTYLHIYIVLISFLGSIGLAFWLIPLYGILGAAMANGLGGILFLGMRTYYGQREYQSVERFYRTILASFILIIAGFINYYTENLICRTLFLLGLLMCLFFMYRDVLIYGKTLALQMRKDSSSLR